MAARYRLTASLERGALSQFTCQECKFYIPTKRSLITFPRAELYCQSTKYAKTEYYRSKCRECLPREIILSVKFHDKKSMRILRVLKRSSCPRRRLLVCLPILTKVNILFIHYWCQKRFRVDCGSLLCYFSFNLFKIKQLIAIKECIQCMSRSARLLWQDRSSVPIRQILTSIHFNHPVQYTVISDFLLR